jgi:hypothetical protein
MISGIGYSPMQGTQGLQQMQSPPQMPNPDEMLDKGIQKLEDNISSGKVDTEELASKLADRFGDKADGIVGEDGSVDFDKLKSLLTRDRNDKLKEGLTKQFGEEAAAGAFNEDGSINEDSLKSLLSSAQGGQGMMPPPPGDMSGASGSGAEGEGDFLAEVNGDAPPPPPPGGMGGMDGMRSSRDTSSSDSSTSLDSMIKQFLSQQSDASGYGANGETKSNSSSESSLISFFA